MTAALGFENKKQEGIEQEGIGRKEYNGRAEMTAGFSTEEIPEREGCAGCAS